MAKKKKRKVNTRSARPVKKNKKDEYSDSVFIKAITTIVSMSLATFVALSIFSMCGNIGEIIRNLILSIFGSFGYFFPVVMVIASFIDLFFDRKYSNIKIYALIVIYIMFICMYECLYNEFLFEKSLGDYVNESILKTHGSIGFSYDNFSGGLLGTSIVYIMQKALGVAGAGVAISTIALIAILYLFGIGISKKIIAAISSIFMFVPNALEKKYKMKNEEIKNAIRNESEVRKALMKSKKLRLSTDSKELLRDETKKPIKEIREIEKRIFDTANLKINSNDIQSRFFDANKTNNSDKYNLLKEMKKKSINEIMYQNKDVDANTFFYTDGMKPIEQIDTVNKMINETKIPEIKTFNSDYIEEQNDAIFNEDKNFARGLNELRKGKDSLDVKNMTSHQILSTESKLDIELKNNTLSNEDMVTRLARKKRSKKYKYPPVSFLNKSERRNNTYDTTLNEKAEILVETLKQFGVGVTILNITVGPSVTRFELKPDLGVKVSKILSLENDVKLALASSEIRIEAPIPGKSAIGIEIPNKESSGVLLGDIISSREFREAESKLTVAIGKDISGKVITTDLRKMPHLLIAGATGSGKSVCINTIITSLIYKSSPEDVRLIMVDPKVVELQIYDGIPHLLVPVVTNAKKATGALNWAVNEMTRRYNLIQEKRVRDIESYNAFIEGEKSKITINSSNEAELDGLEKLPYIVIIIDEFADLMMVSSKEVENAIMRIAQLARACGIYLVIATQRPSVNVISGSIKTNVPSRISFAVASGVDSQTILDRRGAEKLLGHGDMLYFPQGIPEPIRVQGCYVSEKEILNIVDYVKDIDVDYNMDAEMAIERGYSNDTQNSQYNPNEKDEMFFEAGQLIIEQQSASIGMLQRRFRMGFNRAARIMDQLESEGVISKQDGKKPREVLLTIEEFNDKYK